MDLTRPTALYRIFDEHDVLLYVGVSFTPETRWRAHTKTAWWSQVHHRVVEWHPDRPTARAAERAAIKTEKPVGNIAETPLNDTKTYIAVAAWKRYAAQQRAERERAFVAEYVAGASVRDIAKRARRSQKAIRELLMQHDISA